MSVDTFVFLNDEYLPSIQQWQESLDQETTGVTLEDVGDLRAHSGYLPARFKEHPSGFEWLYGSVADVFGQAPVQIAARRNAADFITHSDMRELICGLYAAAVLTKLSNGIFFDEESGAYINGDQALALARRIESEVKLSDRRRGRT